jgi:hypothetical protein
VVKPPGWYAGFVLEEARLGNPHPLIGRLIACLQGSKTLSDGEIQFIVGALEATAGKRSAASLRGIEQILITEQVEALMSDGMPQKEAIGEVMRQRGRSRRHIFSALKAKR